MGVIILFVALVAWGLIVAFDHVDDEEDGTEYHRWLIFSMLLLVLEVALMVDYYKGFPKLQWWLRHPCGASAKEGQHARKNLKTRKYGERLPTALVIIVVVLGLALSITYPISDREDPDKLIDSNFVDNFEIVGTFICGILSLLVMLAYWEYVAFFFSQHEWVYAMLHLSIFGTVLVESTRFLHLRDNNISCFDQVLAAIGCLNRKDDINTRRTENPKKLLNPFEWFARHPREKVIDNMILITFVVTTLLSVMGTILLAAFAEISNALAGDGGNNTATVVGIYILFAIMAHLLMINPFVGASMIDIAGGFLLTQIAMSAGASFIQALMINMAVLIAMHFTGSCLQYLIGKVQTVQAWLNRTAPSVLLAASDSVYKSANCFRVGLIGGAFPDTVNGLNQGRMGMAFWTQFWSEWSAIPNAVCLILFGCLIGANDPNANSILPLSVLVAVIVNIIQTSYAFSELNKAVYDNLFWTALEKWNMIHYNGRRGYYPTEDGWKNDVYKLKPFYDVIWKYIMVKEEHLKDRNKTLDTKQKTMIYKRYEEKLETLREQHFEKFDEAFYTEAMSKGWLEYELTLDLAKDEKDNMWRWAKAGETIDGKYIPGGKMHWWGQLFIMIVMYMTAMFAYVGLYVSDEQLIVEEGYNAITKTSYWELGVVGVILHYLFAIIYWWDQVKDFGESTKKSCDDCLKCCMGGEEKVEGPENMERTFQNPEWPSPESGADGMEVTYKWLEKNLPEEVERIKKEMASERPDVQVVADASPTQRSSQQLVEKHVEDFIDEESSTKPM